MHIQEALCQDLERYTECGKVRKWHGHELWLSEHWYRGEQVPEE
jgi:hypothetical protein